VAGGASCNANDEGGPATSTCTSGLTGIALDKQGNFYILVQTTPTTGIPAFVVRKVNTAGIITTVAGGASSSSGDGGPATKAGFGSFGFPSGLAIDAAGNLYIIDGNSVRMVNAATGIITTIAGTFATAGFFGDGGPAAKAQLAGPVALAFDSAGNLYIADNFNNRVRRVDTNGIITTVAGDPNRFGRS
jgi:sugar lactone lactonase YvrE